MNTTPNISMCLRTSGKTVTGCCWTSFSDYDDLYRAEAMKENARRRDIDSDLMQRIMDRYDRERPVDYRRMVAEEARQYLVERIDRRIALQCAVALKRRDFAIEVLPDAMVSLAVRGGKLHAQ